MNYEELLSVVLNPDQIIRQISLGAKMSDYHVYTLGNLWLFKIHKITLKYLNII